MTPTDCMVISGSAQLLMQTWHSLLQESRTLMDLLYLWVVSVINIATDVGSIWCFILALLQKISSWFSSLLLIEVEKK